ncbi:MAG: ATP-binding protein [Chloroflexaceae bacterium]|nr:ATP-binding protein [Chloroflexaceae bacterium]
MLAVNTISSHAHRVEQLQIQRLSETVLQELQSSAVEMLQTFDPGVEDIEIWSQSGVRPTLYIRHRDFGLAPLSMFGDGMRRILLMATTIPLCKDGVLLIDELEIALHTQALHTSFDWLVQSCVHNNIQLVATTHSLETVDALLEVCRHHENLVVYRLEHHKDQTTTTTLDKELLITLREELGREVRW